MTDCTFVDSGHSIDIIETPEGALFLGTREDLEYWRASERRYLKQLAGIPEEQKWSPYP